MKLAHGKFHREPRSVFPFPLDFAADADDFRLVRVLVVPEVSVVLSVVGFGH